MQNMEVQYTTVLDLGSSQVSLIIGEVAAKSDRSYEVHILGHCRLSHAYMRKGVITHLEGFVDVLQNLLDEGERQTGLSLTRVRASVASALAQSEATLSQTHIKGHEVRQGDIDKLHSYALLQHPQQGFEYIHIIPHHYTLDGRVGIENPLGMCGDELGVTYYRHSYPKVELKNLQKACNLVGVEVETWGAEALAAAEAVLTPDEKELGVCSINLGSNFTHVAIYYNHFPVLTKDYPIGSHHITKDISIGLRTTQAEAERLKREFAQAFYAPLHAHDVLTIQTVDGRSTRDITKGELWNIVEPRVREIFTTVINDIRSMKLASLLLRGAVLSGGGALLPGMCVAAEECLNMSVRLGYPKNLTGVVEGLTTPLSATALGLFSPLFLPEHDLKPKGGWNRLWKNVRMHFLEKLIQPFS